LKFYIQSNSRDTNWELLPIVETRISASLAEGGYFGKKNLEKFDETKFNIKLMKIRMD